ncbi:hypothetical protein ACWET9_29170 [Streptomyces sp. NPDC004059]
MPWPPGTPDPEPRAQRLKTVRPRKAALAAHAMRHIEPGMAVLLDDSTTVLEMARRLRLARSPR